MWETIKDYAQKARDIINPLNWMDYFQGKQASRQTEHLWHIDRGDRLTADRKNREMAYEFAKHGLRWKVADARAAGISPIVAMGGSTYHAPASRVGGSIPHFTGARAGSRPPLGEAKLQAELLRAQIRNIDAQTEKIMSGQLDSVPVPDRPIAGKGGATSGLHQQYKVVGDDSHGYRLQNLETSEFEEDPMGWFQTGGRKIGIYAKGITYPMLSKRQKKIVRNALRRQRQIMLMVDPQPPGRTFKYDRGSGKWFHARDDGNLFMDEDYRKLKKYAPPHKQRRGDLKKKYGYLEIPVPYGKRR